MTKPRKSRNTNEKLHFWIVIGFLCECLSIISAFFTKEPCIIIFTIYGLYAVFLIPVMGCFPNRVDTVNRYKVAVRQRFLHFTFILTIALFIQSEPIKSWLFSMIEQMKICFECKFFRFLSFPI